MNKVQYWLKIKHCHIILQKACNLTRFSIFFRIYNIQKTLAYSHALRPLLVIKRFPVDSIGVNVIKIGRNSVITSLDVNFTNVLCAAFTFVDPERVKKYNYVISIFLRFRV